LSSLGTSDLAYINSELSFGGAGAFLTDFFFLPTLPDIFLASASAYSLAIWAYFFLYLLK
jgi:hypothetical protein